VPVRNEAAHLRTTLEQLVQQDYDPARFEVLVADGRSTDATADIVREFERRWPNVRLLDNPGVYSSAGRNRALRVARGEIVVIVDGHCQIDGRNYLRELASAFERSGADSVGRPQPLDISGATTVQRAIAAARSCWLGHHPDSHIYSTAEQFVPPHSVAIAYRRSVFRTVGMFDESFDACEDVEFNHRVARAVLTCFFTPRVAAHYVPRASLPGLFRQMVRYGRGRVRLLGKHPETFTFPCFVPAAFVTGLVVGAVAALISGWLGLVYAAVLGVYCLLVAVVSADLAVKKRDVSILPWLPLAFAAIHVGAGTGMLREWFDRWRRRRAEPVPGAASARAPADR
jgi:succinoglycan biosynthesis protein ExoA